MVRREPIAQFCINCGRWLAVEGDADYCQRCADTIDDAYEEQMQELEQDEEGTPDH